MDKYNIISDIDNQISRLGSLQTIFGTKTNRFDGFVVLDKIDSKITSVKKTYYFYLGLSIVLGGLLYVAGFAQIFDLKFVDLSKSGLLIILAVGDIFMTIRNKIDLERLKIIKYLLGLKQIIKQE
jgi:cytochrome c biogenesis protein CcdA